MPLVRSGGQGRLWPRSGGHFDQGDRGQARQGSGIAEPAELPAPPEAKMCSSQRLESPWNAENPPWAQKVFCLTCTSFLILGPHFWVLWASERSRAAFRCGKSS